MSNINFLILEDLSSHFKKHWKKYALGLGAGALAVGGHKLHKNLKTKNKLTKIGIATGGLTAGSGLAYLHHRLKPNNNTTNNYNTTNHNTVSNAQPQSSKSLTSSSKASNSNKESKSLSDNLRDIAKDAVHTYGNKFLDVSKEAIQSQGKKVLDTITNHFSQKISDALNGNK